MGKVLWQRSTAAPFAGSFDLLNPLLLAVNSARLPVARVDVREESRALLTFPGRPGCLPQFLGLPPSHPALCMLRTRTEVSRSLSREMRFQISIWVLQANPFLPGLVEKQVAD